MSFLKRTKLQIVIKDGREYMIPVPVSKKPDYSNAKPDQHKKNNRKGNNGYVRPK